jgi:hypothetical protein
VATAIAANAVVAANILHLDMTFLRDRFCEDRIRLDPATILSDFRRPGTCFADIGRAPRPAGGEQRRHLIADESKNNPFASNGPAVVVCDALSALMAFLGIRIRAAPRRRSLKPN